MLFPLTYQRVSSAVRLAASIDSEAAREYTYQDDLEVVCLPAAALQASSAFDIACRRAGLRANLAKTTITPGRSVELSTSPVGLRVENRALVLKHGSAGPLPAMPSQTAVASESSLEVGSPEVKQVCAARAKFFVRLQQLRVAGLPALTCQSLARHRTGGDALYVARARGIPASDASKMDEELARQVIPLLGLSAHELSGPLVERIFCSGKGGGLGFQSLAASAGAAYAASWHSCTPRIISRLELRLSQQDLVEKSFSGDACTFFWR